MAPAEDELAPDDQPADVADPLAHGYVIRLAVLPDGQFRVSEPEPLPAPEAEADETEPAEPASPDYPTLTEALRALVARIEAHPIEASEQTAFERGFGRPALPALAPDEEQD